MSGQLADAATGRHVWSDKIEGSVEEVFDFQDQITECVVGAIQPSLLEAEAERLSTAPRTACRHMSFISEHCRCWIAFPERAVATRRCS